MINDKLLEVAKFACSRARAKGANEAAASVRSSRSFKIVIRDSKQEELKSSESRRLSIRIFVDGRYGQHTTSDLGREALGRFVDDAVEMTRFLMPDKHRALPLPALYKGRPSSDLQIYDQASQAVTTAQRKESATRLHDAARAAGGDKVISVGAGRSDTITESVLFHTNGFADGERSTSHGIWADVSVKDPAGKRPSDWAQSMARRASELQSPEAVGKLAAQRALACIGGKKIATCTLPLIVENRSVGRLLSGLLRPLDGWALDQKRSCFDGKQGQVVTTPLFGIIDDPLLAQGWGSRRYDGEGISSKRMPIIEKGVLKNFYIDTYYGKKLGKPPTTSGSSNLVFPTGKRDVEGLCKAAGKAILVTRFIGGNSNSTTGDFSVGINGFLIEGGKRTQPLSSMNLAGNHLKFWKTLVRVGNDPYPHSSRRAPSLQFKPILVAGK
jgi:PmbA protein